LVIVVESKDECIVGAGYRRLRCVDLTA